MKLSIATFLSAHALAWGATHHLFVGTFSGARIYALEFDDVALTLSLAANISSPSAHSWIALSHDKMALYGVGNGNWYSYAVHNGSSVTDPTTVAITGNCTQSSSGTTSNGTLSTPGGGAGGAAGGVPVSSTGAHGIFIMAAETAPYAVYADPFGPCANVMSVTETGQLSTVTQNISFLSTSGVHGMAMTPDGGFLYAADDSANAIWTYSVDGTTGLLAEVDMISGPSDGSNPRHVAVHPGGQYAYVVLEEANQLAQYAIDRGTGKLTLVGALYSLIGDGVSSSGYWSDEVAVSSTGTYLWATSRARDTNATGYISVYSLALDGSISQQLLLTNTTTSGGSANAVAPAFFSDKWAALTDAQEGFVQVWTVDAAGTAQVVAQLALNDGGCCANAVWFD